MNDTIELTHSDVALTIENQVRDYLGGGAANSEEEFDQIIREKVDSWVSVQGPQVIIGLVLAQEIYHYDIEGMSLLSCNVTPLNICTIVLGNSLRDTVISKLMDLAPFEDEDFD